MANLQEVVSWDAGVYQLETSDPVLGGPGGTSNKQAQALANRTAYLKKHMDDLEGGTTAAGKANKLTTARTIAVAGDVTGQASFDGSGNISITATYKNSGVVAGTYRSVTVDAKGNVTAGSNPTTLSGYGITDAVPSSQKGAANGVATLDSGGKVPVAQIPATAITDTFVVGTQAAMLALTAEIGDVAVRTDLKKSFILRVAGASTLANWQELLTPTDAVQSVDGMTGVVVIATASEGVKGKAQIATQAEVDAGTDDSKFVTALKLMNWVKQAGESVLGMLKVATQAQTNAGAADDVAVTPKKLRAGFAASFATAGYLAFPTWMGGLIIQWGSIFVTANSTATGSLPIAFPTAVFQGVCTYDSPVGSIYPTSAMNFPSLSTYQIGVKSAAGTNFIMRYIAIGY
ncbi:phage tail protein [Aeromonas sp. sif0611]|uniref:gp53-like domain-containing protein n=1 Tax=Aeromonas sp. sif0611 TaxID=2854787 RepID=UPI00210D9704|nr:phage tail protein [Aeromonas sp. sif0611]